MLKIGFVRARTMMLTVEISKNYRSDFAHEFYLLRKTRLSRRRLYLWGKGMGALNYWWPYAFGRAFLISLRYPSGGYSMSKGYLSKVASYGDIGEFVSSFQRKRLLKRLRETLMGWIDF